MTFSSEIKVRQQRVFALRRTIEVRNVEEIRTRKMNEAEMVTTTGSDSSSFRKSNLLSSLLDYLGVDSSSELAWGHAVNSRTQLEACLNNKKPQMLEADILLSEQSEAIMCHPPLRESDITFREWLEAVVSHLIEATKKRKRDSSAQ